MEPLFSPKVEAYMHASAIVKRARFKQIGYDSKTVKAINAELQLVAKQLNNSAKRIIRSEALKKFLEQRPEKVKDYEHNQKILGIINARNRQIKLSKQLSNDKKKEEKI